MVYSRTNIFFETKHITTKLWQPSKNTHSHVSIYIYVVGCSVQRGLIVQYNIDLIDEHFLFSMLEWQNVRVHTRSHRISERGSVKFSVVVLSVICHDLYCVSIWPRVAYR